MPIKNLGIAGAALLCALAVASCDESYVDPSVKEEPVEDVLSDVSFEITAAESTKATEYKASDFIANGFKVGGYNTTAFKEQVSICTVQYNSTREVWSTSVYWPSTASSINFYGVYPPSLSMSRSGSVYSVQVGSSGAAYDGLTDVLVAKKTGVTSAASPIPLAFTHPLTYVGGAKVRLTSEAPSGWTVTVSSLKIGAPAYGTYGFDTERFTPSGSQTLTYSTSSVSAGTSAYVDVPGTGRMFIPYALDGSGKSSHALTIEYTVKDGSGNVVESHTGSSAVALSVKLTPGKRAILSLAIPLGSQPVIVPVVDLEDWNTTDDRNVNW